MANFETNVVKPEVSFMVKEDTYRLISLENEVLLDNGLKQAEDFLANNTGEGLTEEEKDILYAQAQLLYKDYYVNLRDNKYSFYLNRKQYKFLVDLLLSKLEYDADNIFVALELNNVLLELKKTVYKSDDELLAAAVTATELTYIYHLISKFKVKGLTDAAFIFAQVLVKVGDLSKIVNYYDTSAKNLNTEIQKWAASLSGSSLIQEPSVEA